ncbi:mitochondrial ribosomal protein l24 [Plakobranchus ocellatus]|uniref:Mitochondrial ribosomal protein l24 n=1 Tax=Plakobranchus ocellatus TaxID=259542 RepID=A0AAV4AFC7_9GAST|nr:mitochondrial ribosomal protein l24 [Plakobranchus ocellatus]
MRLTIVAFGYFKKYVQREIAKASGVTMYKPIQGWRHERKRDWIYDENRPWTDAAKEANLPGKKLREFVVPLPESEWTIFKGDRSQGCIMYIERQRVTPFYQEQ